MGKKSKKGVSRAGIKTRPAAGQGRTPRKGRSGSKSYGEDGRSIASQDDVRSFDSEPTKAKAVVPPGDVAFSTVSTASETTSSESNKENNKTTLISFQTKEEPAPVPKKVDLWSGNLRDAVNADEEGPAVLDVTIDDTAADEHEEVAPVKVAAPEAAQVIQSRGLLSLTEPAPEEAKNKLDDCQCVIL